MDLARVRREANYRIPKRDVRRVAAVDATRITHLVFPAKELLMYPVARSLGPIQCVTSLTVRLEWQGAGLDQLRLEDERQTIIERTQNGDVTSVLIRIQQATDQNEPRPWPIAGDDFHAGQFEADLGEDRFIKPREPDIERQARIWFGDEKTAVGALRAHSAGVFKYLQGGTLIAETLSAPEILQSREGKCSEHAILFASAARAVGIPTRIVLGMRIVQGTWVGHMWDEAYVGHWITVDSTANEVETSPSLLKLVHSDTVLGPQPVRWAAVNALQVTCVDSSPAPDDIDAALKAGIDGGVYTNAQFACRLTVPAANWSIKDVTSKQPFSPTVIRFKVPGQDHVLIHFVPFDVPPTFTPRILIGTRAAQFKLKSEEFQVLRDEVYMLQTMAGRLFEFRRKGSPKAGVKMLTTDILWSDGRSTFLLNLITDEMSHAEYAADFFKLVKRFESLRTDRRTPK